MVIAHELTHVRRRDVLAAYVSRAVLLLWWFNPLIWMLAAAERRVREEACDEDVVRNAAIPPAAYCDTLVRAAAASAGHPLALATAFAGEHPLQRRIRRVMTLDRASRPRGRLAFVLLASIVIAAQLLATPRTAPPARAAAVEDGLTTEGELLMEATIELFNGGSPSPSPSPSP
jgi:beta-lactamase regulating signal transducer with metallopeptidase domain